MQETLLFVHNVQEVRFFVINETNQSEFMKYEEPNPITSCSHVESVKGPKTVIMESGKTNLVVYNMKLTNKRTGEEERWLVQLGKGNPQDVTFDWNSIKPKDMEFRPQHGIAACLNRNLYRGKSFCFLPLPDYTYLPVHIHGQFVLHSDRRCLWISSSDNVTSQSTCTDYKHVWNEHLIKAIGASYSHFLTHCVVHDGPICTKEESMKSLHSYYKLFPEFNRRLEEPYQSKKLDEPWKTLAREVYSGLNQLNSQILATLVKADHLDSQESKHNKKQMYSITWYNLHLPQAPEEGYFHTYHEYFLSTCRVLKAIGMNLIDTPMDICNQFKEVGIDLPVISKESVLKYYIKFHDDIYRQHKLPCRVSNTRFNRVECFVAFVKYLSIHDIIQDHKIANSNDEQDTNTLTAKDTTRKATKTTTKTTTKATTTTMTTTITTEDIVAASNCGFLITVDGFIHALSDGKRIINSVNYHLFPKSENVFLHKAMSECSNSNSLFQVTESGEGYELIHSVFSSNLPLSWCRVTQAALGDIEISWVKKLLVCISEDPIFKVYKEQLLKDFTLIPAYDNTMFSSSSKVLPMKDDCYSTKKIERVLRKLKVSFVNSEIIGSALKDTTISLPNITEANDILKTVYLISEDCKYNLITLNDEELEILFDIFRSVAYFSDSKHTNESVFYIKQLPIFKTIHGELSNFSSASKVWIWNDQVCKEGTEEWICHIPKSVIFLDPNAPWAVLVCQAEHLNMKEISLYEVYCDYIFPHFNVMDSAMRIEHIKFIALKVFRKCKHESESDYTDSLDRNAALKFINKFKILKCIGDDSMNLQTISSFYDHTQKLFTVFCDEKCFLPKELQDEDIQESLKFFGLRSVPTTTEFLDYCHSVSDFTETSTVIEASQILLNILFQDKDQYKHIYEESFLQQVSDIPIAIIQSSPELNDIAKQHLGDCHITDDSGTVELTKLYGSCIVKYKHCVWTCKPLVQLPAQFHWSVARKVREARVKALGISLVPSIDDVVQNLTNLANTKFANFSRFHHRDSQQTAKISCDLPNVVVSMMKCIIENEEHATITELRNQLEDLNFLPVKLTVNGYALVKPAQVLVMDPSSLLPYYPFLHPLEKSLQPFLQFLSQISVKISLDFSHIQLFFKLAKEVYKDKKVDINIKKAAAKAMEELIMLLRKSKPKEDVHLQPLYLLNEQDVLTECSKLIVFNISGNQQLVLPPEFTYLNPLKDLSTSIHWGPEELCHLLPEDVGLKSLRSIVQYEILNSVPVQTPYPCVTVIEQILQHNMFKTAIEKYACYCIHVRQPPQNVTEILTNFQNQLQVKYLVKVLVKPQLNVNNEVISLQDTLCQEFFLQCCNDTFVLSLKNTPSCYPTQVFRKMSQQLCAALQLQATKCFDLTEGDEVLDLISFISELLNCSSVFKITDVIMKHIPGCDDIDQDIEPTNPVLGEIIPECWLHRLDQNPINCFNPIEWVGYEIEDGKIVYAQVLHIAEITEQLLQQKYVISIGNDTPIETTVLKLYKFICEEPAEQFISQVLSEVEEALGTEERMYSFQAADRNTIRDAVKAAWSLQEEERRKAIKRLYLQYHPDKNPDNPHATANFQLLQEEIARMEQGISEVHFNTNQDIGSSYSSFRSAEWSGWFNQWNRTASSHCRYRSRSRRSRSREMPNGWNIPKPKKENSEAKRWIKQAEYDYIALEILSKNYEKTCAATCFMSHEVAEKSLKAGMYAKCGMGSTTLKCHSLVTPACALVQVGCLVDINDAIFLENFYSEPRFPYCYSSPIVPGEKYLSSTAREAFLAATRIYEAMKQLIEDDE